MSDKSELSDDTFRALFERAADGMLIVDNTGRITDVNEQLATMFEYAREELIGEALELLVPEAHVHAHAQLRKNFMKTPEARPMGSGRTVVGRTKTGLSLPVEITLTPLQGTSGSMVCAAVRNITARRLEESAVRRADLLLRGALESYYGALAVFDDAEELVTCNSTYRTMFGPSLIGDLSGRAYADLVDAFIESGELDNEHESRDETRSRWIDYHDNPEGELTLRTTKSRHLRMFERRTVDGATIVTAVDATRDVKRDAALRKARAAAEQASAAKSEFLSSMSHELRTPLNAVLGFAQLLRRDKKEPLSERHLDRLSHVIKGGEHLLRLIDDVLDLSRIESGRVTLSTEPVKLADSVTELLSTLEPLAEENSITLSVTQEDLATWVVADRTRLSQILLNFGSNAIKYGRDGGTVEIVTSAADGRVRIEVRDDGIGIAEKYHKHIFKAFRRAGQETGPIEGTGIGLAICKRLAEAMDGRVGFQSMEGKGSTFWLDLPEHDPVAPSSHATPSIPASTAATLGRAKHKVVYVEDNPSNVALMEEFVEDFKGIDLIVAPNAELGIELIRTHQPAIVVMDLHLPGMSGFTATERLKEDPETTTIPVVALSAAAMAQDRKRAEEVGFYRYLTKPVQVDQLAEIFDELLRAARA